MDLMQYLSKSCVVRTMLIIFCQNESRRRIKTQFMGVALYHYWNDRQTFTKAHRGYTQIIFMLDPFYQGLYQRWIKYLNFG